VLANVSGRSNGTRVRKRTATCCERLRPVERYFEGITPNGYVLRTDPGSNGGHSARTRLNGTKRRSCLERLPPNGEGGGGGSNGD